MRAFDWTWSYLYWGVGFLAIAFLVPELCGEWRVGPIRTFSETWWHADRTYAWLPPILLGLWVGLGIHFFQRQPLWTSLAKGLLISAAATVIESV